MTKVVRGAQILSVAVAFLALRAPRLARVRIPPAKCVGEAALFTGGFGAITYGFLPLLGGGDGRSFHCLSTPGSPARWTTHNLD
jgi:hypothetical protein